MSISCFRIKIFIKQVEMDFILFSFLKEFMKYCLLECQWSHLGLEFLLGRVFVMITMSLIDVEGYLDFLFCLLSILICCVFWLVQFHLTYWIFCIKLFRTLSYYPFSVYRVSPKALKGSISALLTSGVGVHTRSVRDNGK